MKNIHIATKNRKYNNFYPSSLLSLFLKILYIHKCSVSNKYKYSISAISLI